MLKWLLELIWPAPAYRVYCERCGANYSTPNEEHAMAAFKLHVGGRCVL